MIIQSRPRFAELCKCVAIMFNTSESMQYDGAKLVRRAAIIEQAYQRGADYLLDVDCKCCAGTGVVPITNAA